MVIESRTIEWGRLNFGRGDRMNPLGVRRPFAERVIVRCPRLASILSAVGARSVPSDGGPPAGRLAAMMTASRSIDIGRGQRRNYRFYIRPMS
ncbi:MAG: hypothetical protein PHN82_10440 [bacterium]|nr:hypothetical protein [bacterium]